MATGTRALTLFFFFSFSTDLSFANSDKVSATAFTSTRGEPWPLPASYITTEQVNILNVADFRFTVGEENCDILRQAFVRYQLAIFGGLADKTHTLRYTC